MPTAALRLSIAVFARGERALYDAITELRVRNGSSVRAVAKACGIPQSTLDRKLKEFDHVILASLDLAGVTAEELAEPDGVAS